MNTKTLIVKYIAYYLGSDLRVMINHFSAIDSVLVLCSIKSVQINKAQ